MRRNAEIKIKSLRAVSKDILKTAARMQMRVWDLNSICEKIEDWAIELENEEHGN